VLLSLYIDCVIRHVTTTIKYWGNPIRYTINGASHELDSKISGGEDLIWILLNADVLLLFDMYGSNCVIIKSLFFSGDPNNMVTALNLDFRRWGSPIPLLVGNLDFGKSRTLSDV
jgi:hypothetical protein